MTNKIITGKKNVWRYSLLNLAVFIFLVVIFDIVFGILLNHFYFTLKSGTQYRTTYSIEKTKADILVFGSSRAVHHYYPSIFEDRFKLSFYNAGRDGQESSLYHYGVLQGILKRYTPKIVILDIMRGELGTTLYSYDRLAALTPYYSSHPEMRPIIELRSAHEKLRMVSGIYPFNSLIMSIISGNLDMDGKKNEDVKGYIPMAPRKPITTTIETIDMSKAYELDSIKVNVLRLFIKDCLRLNIRLYIVCSPYYEKYIGTDHSILTIKKMAAADNVNFFDFSQEKLFLESPKLFGNAWHLKDSGAKVFSNMLIDKIELAERSGIGPSIK